MDTISSKNNTVIKYAKKLLTSSKFRRDNCQFVLEGARLCFDVLCSDYSVDILLITQQAMDKYPHQSAQLAGVAGHSYLITPDIAQKLGDTATTQGVFAICDIPVTDTGYGNRMVALDNVQDPANVGAIIRTAEALGIDGVIVAGGCDIYNPKALRASMGSALRINILICDDLADTITQLKSDGYCAYATVPDRTAQPITDVDFGDKTICVIGNEANGVSNEVMVSCDSRITIPMLGRAESLNAGVAASITMWEMMR
ncbi:MAG: RNA methyltransferase [Eubacteriales bacterium]|nr:RNA methyltransferase [Eubacteriales bacterium]